MENSVDELIARLGASDERGRREAGDALLRLGAVPALVQALGEGNPEVRKPAAFLLGRAGDGSPGVLSALEAALVDPEAKVRKNAAVALGRLGAGSAVDALGQALAAEEMLWVRPSIVLALGALGAPAAHVLRSVTPRSDEEMEALRKAQDRAGGQGEAVRWREDGWRSITPLLSVPHGLERVAADEAAERGIPAPKRVRPGLLSVADLPYSALFPALRCVYAVRYPIAWAPSAGRADPAELPRQVEALLARAGQLAAWRDWIDAPGGVLRYRFAISGMRVARATILEILERVRSVLRPMGLEDSPSAYAAELQLDYHPRGCDLHFTPTFVRDERFAYRVADVGASINPVVGACLARLVRKPGTVQVLDPTCGSATLLVERAMLDPAVRGRGVDVSPTAVRAAETNVLAAGLAERIEVTRGNAEDPRAWTECDELLANLPFGVRTGRPDASHTCLYAEIAANLSWALRPGGRAVLYTSDRRALQAALDEQSEKLEIERTHQTRSGGLDVGIWVLRRR
jgi:predicted RNA methylase